MEDDAVSGINEGIVAANANVAYTDQSGHGYVLVDVDRERVQAEWWETGTALAAAEPVAPRRAPGRALEGRRLAEDRG